MVINVKNPIEYCRIRWKRKNKNSILTDHDDVYLWWDNVEKVNLLLSPIWIDRLEKFTNNWMLYSPEWKISREHLNKNEKQNRLSRFLTSLAVKSDYFIELYQNWASEWVSERDTKSKFKFKTYLESRSWRNGLKSMHLLDLYAHRVGEKKIQRRYRCLDCVVNW